MKVQGSFTIRRISGLLVCLAATFGLAMSLGTILSVGPLSNRMLPQILALHRAGLEAKKVPPDTIEQVSRGEEISTNAFQRLDRAQQIAVRDFQLIRSNFVWSLDQAKTLARARSNVGLLGSILLLVLGIALFRRRPPGSTDDSRPQPPP